MVVLVAVFVWVVSTVETASATDHSSTSSAKIVDVLNENIMLLEDGSLWRGAGVLKYLDKTNFISIVGDFDKGWGLTKDGEVFSWQDGNPHLTRRPALQQIVQLGNGYGVKQDGTVWSRYGQIDGLRQIKWLSSYDQFHAALDQEGTIYRWHSDTPYQLEKVGNVPTASKIYLFEDQIALIDRDKTAAYYDTAVATPITIASGVKDLVWRDSNRLVLVKEDGTVWNAVLNNNEFVLTQDQRFTSSVRVVVSSTSDNYNLLVMQKDGTWLSSSNDKITTMKAPTLTSVKVKLPKQKVKVGESFSIKFEEQYSNGYKEERFSQQHELQFSMPQHVVQLKNNSFKAKAVGEITFQGTVSGEKAEGKIWVTSDKPLQKAVQKDGVLYVPLKSLFETIGGTLTFDSNVKKYHIQLGSKQIKLQVGSKVAWLDGQKIVMKGPVHANGKTIVFPAELLKHTSKAVITWDKEYKRAVLNFGQARMMVESDETAKVFKNERLGTLVRFIGVTYWINDFHGWERFNKVTVTDIRPVQQTGDFIIVFKHANGKTIHSVNLPEHLVEFALTHESIFLHYDPYKRYNWPKPIWDKVKKGIISLGMTKEQVLLSWGTPQDTTYTSSPNLVLELWTYRNEGKFSIITFRNGTVSRLYQS